MAQTDRYTVLKCVPRRDGTFLVMLLRGGSASSDTSISEGKTVRVRDGKVVEVVR